MTTPKADLDALDRVADELAEGKTMDEWQPSLSVLAARDEIRHLRATVEALRVERDRLYGALNTIKNHATKTIKEHHEA